MAPADAGAIGLSGGGREPTGIGELFGGGLSIPCGPLRVGGVRHTVRHTQEAVMAKYLLSVYQPEGTRPPPTSWRRS